MGQYTAGNITLTVPGNFLEQDMAETVRQELKAGADELGMMELFNITARTPHDTYALQQDEFYKTYSEDSPTIVVLGVRTENQDLAWGRVYAQYQEGGVLGESTYTNGPHEMFGRVLTDDISQIGEWGVRQCEQALDRLAAGVGAGKGNMAGGFLAL